MKSRFGSFCVLTAIFLLVAGHLVACSNKSETPTAAVPAQTASAPSPSPSISITSVRAVQRDLAVTIKATGTVTPLSSIDVRPQVTSIITKVHFKEGQFVRAGEVLFTLDSRTDEANLAKARAQLAKDQAALADARRQLARSQELLAKNFISQGAVDTSQANVDSQSALLAADKAAVDAALIALSFDRITAAQAGRVGAINVFAGSSVQANQTTLVTITQLDPIAVSFNLPQSNLSDALLAIQGAGTSVTATLPNNGGSFTGTSRFVDNAVDAASGTIKMKAVFDNRAAKLWPNAFVDITLTARTLSGAVVVPRAAIIHTARGTMVYVVENAKANPRPVQVLFAQGDDAAVGGVKVDEFVVLDGIQNMRPNASVIERTVKPVTPAKPATAPVVNEP